MNEWKSPVNLYDMKQKQKCPLFFHPAYIPVLPRRNPFPIFKRTAQMCRIRKTHQISNNICSQPCLFQIFFHLLNSQIHHHFGKRLSRLLFGDPAYILACKMQFFRSP